VEAMKTLLFACVCAAALAVAVYAQKSNEEKACNTKGNCESCIAGKNGSVSVDCFWCSKPTNKSAHHCRHYTFNSAIPVDGVECESLMYNVGTCRINALVIVILITLLCLVVVVAFCCVCCCCCFFCAKRKQRSRMVEEERYLDEKENIRQRSNDRRTERKAKSDEIKRKYGLNTDGEGTYKRLE
jgi:hypothetical protein